MLLKFSLLLLFESTCSAVAQKKVKSPNNMILFLHLLPVVFALCLLMLCLLCRFCYLSRPRCEMYHLARVLTFHQPNAFWPGQPYLTLRSRT